MKARPELIAIVGPTASGKTGLALDIAERCGGEIICADSRTIYTGMDIGTAKPTAQEQMRVRHWGLDLAEPGERFTVADFKLYAQNAINDIQSRGKLPLIVGGTGLYIDAVLYDFSFAKSTDTRLTDHLKSMNLTEAKRYCIQHNIPLPENEHNLRHVLAVIERQGLEPAKKSTLPSEYKLVGIATSMATLRTRISERSEHLFENGMADEATILGKKYGWDSEAMTGNIYPLIKKHLDGELTIEQVKEHFITADYRLAKRQMTWLRRNPDIMWCTLSGAKHYIDSLLAGE
jgi:tRNA dimethylallyltransferase